jgi:anthranilate synthase component 1
MVSNDLLVVDNLSSKVYIITHIDPTENSYDDAILKLDAIDKDIKKVFEHKTSAPENIKPTDFVSNFGKKNFFKGC